jgi:hypothetical protein
MVLCTVGSIESDCYLGNAAVHRASLLSFHQLHHASLSSFHQLPVKDVAVFQPHTCPASGSLILETTLYIFNLNK